MADLARDQVLEVQKTMLEIQQLLEKEARDENPAASVFFVLAKPDPTSDDPDSLSVDVLMAGARGDLTGTILHALERNLPNFGEAAR